MFQDGLDTYWWLYILLCYVHVHGNPFKSKGFRAICHVVYNSTFMHTAAERKTKYGQIDTCRKIDFLSAIPPLRCMLTRKWGGRRFICTSTLHSACTHRIQHMWHECAFRPRWEVASCPFRPHWLNARITVFSKFFSHVPQGICSLSGSDIYSCADELHHPCCIQIQ